MSGDKGKSDKSRVRRGHFQVDLSGSGLLEGGDVCIEEVKGVLGKLSREREGDGEGNGIDGGRRGSEFAGNESMVIIL